MREPEKLSLQPLFVGRRALSSTIALSGGVAGGKTKVSGDGRVRWLPERTTGLNDEGAVSQAILSTLCSEKTGISETRAGAVARGEDST